ncbi:uncharacterized protein LOC116034604 isoform X1 [Sander lucioperca]|uniref:uncharacterized protein LOC116034604 isoform X1 n=1 Tax=Sander lucioperca TaxID=283035 RepID=UPI00125E412D|nr:uncharacterized protein LOC116034604 isoform X1 [Sander lucioperca]
MKSFLLLILSLMITGWEASSDVKGCTDGWVEFTCQHKTILQYQRVDVDKDKQTIIGSTQMNVWQTKDRFSVYHDAANKKLRVVIKQLQRGDFEDYTCKFIFEQKSDCDKVDLKVGKGCQTPFNQTAYRTAKTTISCDKKKSEVMFFCKENGSICEDILSTKSSPKSNGSFTLTETSSSFNMSISNVSSEHAGVYWCGVETNKGRNRAALRKIQLEVEVPPTTLNSSTISTSTRPVPTSASSTQSTTASAHSDGPPTTSSPGASSLPGTIAVVVCVAVLVLLLILVLVWKRFQRSKDTRNREQNNEDGAYEEIRERLQKPGSGTALSTIYVTVNAPTNPSASQHYSTVNFPNSSGEASGDTYSTVWDSSHSPTHSAVNHPSRLSEDPFYSTVNNPQQH